MNFISQIQKKFKFDDYMVPFLVLFGILYILGAVKLLSMLSAKNGILIYTGYIVGGAIGIILFLKLFQGICRLIGVDKFYRNIRGRK